MNAETGKQIRQAIAEKRRIEQLESLARERDEFIRDELHVISKTNAMWNNGGRCTPESYVCTFQTDPPELGKFYSLGTYDLYVEQSDIDYKQRIIVRWGDSPINYDSFCLQTFFMSAISHPRNQHAARILFAMGFFRWFDNKPMADEYDA